MIILHIHKKNAKTDAIENRIKEMVLAYKVKNGSRLKKMMLTEGDEKIIGSKAIHEYLDKIQGELKQWWYCDC